VTVHSWNGIDFKPTDPSRYEWRDGRWVRQKVAEEAH
jgi:hypothetical protein